MASMTITEGLAELNTIWKRLEKKRQAIMGFLTRLEGIKDPLERQGGSIEFIKRESQAIRDLEARHLAIRMAVQRVNRDAKLKIGEMEMSVAEWLTWRKERAPEIQKHLAMIRNTINAARDQATKRGGAVFAAGAVGDNAKPQDVVVNVDEVALAAEIEGLETTLGVLDGRLSLINATTTIEV